LNLDTREVDSTVRRAATLIVKMLQNVANGLSSKEDWMQPLNYFQERNVARIDAFFNAISVRCIFYIRLIITDDP
jgi:hypothetical protein